MHVLPEPNTHFGAVAYIVATLELAVENLSPLR